MRLFYLLLLFFTVSLQSSFAQNFVTINAHVLDAQSKEPVPFAHVYIQKWHIGTATNESGYFELKIPDKYSQDSIQISSIGYKTIKVPAQNFMEDFTQVFLPVNQIELNTITIESKKPNVKEIVKKASEQFQNLYRAKPYLANFYYHESKVLNDVFTGETDAVGEYYSTGITENGKKNKTHLMSSYRNFLFFDQIRRNEYNWKYDDWYKYVPKGKWNTRYYKSEQSENRYLSHNKMWRFKDHLLYFGPLSEKNLSFFIYNLEDITTYNNELVYVISFKAKPNKNKIKGYGQMYITAESYTVLSIEVGDFFYDNVNLLTHGSFSTYYPDNLLRLSSKATINFALFNGELFFHHFKLNMDYLNPVDTVHLYNELQLSNFSSKECFDLKNLSRGYFYFLSENPLVTYQKSFWDQYDVVNHTSTKDKLNEPYETISLFDKQSGVEGYYHKSYAKKINKNRFIKPYNYIRKVLHETAYGNTTITDANRDSLTVKVKNEATELRNPKKERKDTVLVVPINKQDRDSLQYQDVLLRQVENITNIFGESCKTMFDSISYQSFLTIRDEQVNHLFDSLNYFQSAITPTHYNQTKGTIIGLWLETNLLFTQAKADSVKHYNPKLILDAFDKFDLNNSNYLKSNEFSSYILEAIYTHFYFLENTPDDDLLSNSYQFIANKFEEPVREFLLYKLLAEDVLVEDFGAVFSQFKTAYPKSNYTTKIDDLIEINKDVKQKGDVFPLIDVLTIDSTQTQIDLSNKKLVLIDVWFIGCKPCVEALKFTYPKVIEKYKDNDVAFIFLSSEGNYSKWKSFIDKNQLKGEHFLIEPSKTLETLKLLHINSFPSQLLIENGIIVSDILDSNKFDDELERFIK
ncbi:carboxypeptidase-like regulatory domain-containing protein [Chondrinema litorale]|uniref:carboxypeptidase-like regulatory domain-containing protein n=1 Tax=Chondrinema litorale TaxID=2994555 RepID=UPI00254313DC|nr:carboxypeptidase-like regulatory domain-containing protein [Chondrinema litorale]UZR97750.1 carboxypeptidase-like regulatory domain-containing protein [Chondrinema litorale]